MPKNTSNSSSNGTENIHSKGKSFAGVGSSQRGGDLSGEQSKEAVQGRFDRHENRSRWMHRVLWFAIIILLLLIGRSLFESLLLRQSNEELRGAVEAQTMAISQVGTVSPNLGAGLAPPGSTLTGPDGEVYICPAGPTGTDGKDGEDGVDGVAGLPGGPGYNVTAGNGLLDVDPGVDVVMDINYGRGLAVSTDVLRVLGADGTISVTSSGVRVGLINEGNLNAGFGAGQISAEDSLILDAGGYYLSGDVEGALQEAGPVVAAGLQSIDDTYNNFGPVSPTISVDSAEGQVGNLIFDLTTTQDVAFQDAGTNFAIFDDSGDVTFFNDFGVGAAAGAETLANVGFLPDGDDAFIADTLGVESTIYTDSGLVVGGSTAYSDGLINTTSLTSDLDITTTAGVGAGDITFTPDGDFIIEQGAGTPFATIDAAGGLSITSNFATDALNIDQSFADNALYVDQSSTGTGVQIEKSGASGTNLYVWTSNAAHTGRSVRVANDSTSASTNIGLEITHAGATINPNSDANSLNGSAPLVIQALAEPLVLGGDDSATERSGLLQIGAHDNPGTNFNFIAFNSDIDGDGVGSDAEFRVDGTGEAFADVAYNSGGADYAEYFQTRDTDLQPGELVSIDKSLKGAVRRTSGSGDQAIGVISGNPGFIGNNPLGLNDKEVPETDVLVGLVGQLSVLVNDENGELSIGDYVTTAEQAGYAKKANSGDSILGTALSSVGDNGQALVLVSPNSGAPSLEVSEYNNVETTGKNTSVVLEETQTVKDLTVINEIAAEGIQVLKDIEVKGDIVANSIKIDAEATFNGAVIINDHLAVGPDIAGEVTINAGSQSQRVEFTRQYDEAPLIQLTPKEFGPQYRVETVTTDGFVVAIEEVSPIDQTFSWFAVGQAPDAGPTVRTDAKEEDSAEKISWFQKIIDIATR